jgi:hypothetical protein
MLDWKHDEDNDNDVFITYYGPSIIPNDSNLGFVKQQLQQW